MEFQRGKNSYEAQSSTHDHHFQVGTTPLSNFSTVAGTAILYVLFIKLLQSVFVQQHDAWKTTPHNSTMKFRPLELKWIVFIHNTILSLGSGVLLVALVREMFTLYHEHTMLELFCDPEQMLTRGPHHYLLYINYIFKYVELLDTVLLALRGKPIKFLHIYHHAITLVLVWIQLRGETCVQWVPVMCNLAVHVAMYGYYALNALGYRPWWKRYLTKMQITQFVCVLIVSFFVMGSRAVFEFTSYAFPQPYAYLCHCKDWYTVLFGIAVFASYLVLFLRMYNDTYQRKLRVKRVKRAEGAHSKKKLK